MVFSTYQSIATIHEAQKKHGTPAFDLIVCDEAHRTTGVTLAGADESHFVKVHDTAYIKAAKRLYMTATPRIYIDATKSKAKEADAELCSMDDESLYGLELHRLGFGEAVSARPADRLQGAWSWPSTKNSSARPFSKRWRQPARKRARPTTTISPTS